MELTQPALHFTRTRLAPTPSGYLHLGNVFSFALTAELARRSGAAILLRIDDLDRERMRPAYVADIFDTLRFLHIPWDEGPRDAEDFDRRFSQRYRIELYLKALAELRDSGAVFACGCSRSMIGTGAYPGTCLHKELPLDTPGACWRLRTDDAPEIYIQTLSGTGQAVLTEDMRYFVVRKKDGFPAYQLASVIDDLYYGVDLIVRGMDLLPSTIAQHYLAQKLHRDTFAAITFFHHQLLTEGEGGKLSKSAGATSIQQLRKVGKTPAEVYRQVAELVHISDKPGTWQQLAACVLDGQAAG